MLALPGSFFLRQALDAPIGSDRRSGGGGLGNRLWSSHIGPLPDSLRLARNATDLTSIRGWRVPAAGLLAGGIWLSTQVLALAGTAAESAKTETSSPKAPVPTALDRKPVDWAEVARQLEDNSSSGWQDIQTRLQEHFIAMTLAEATAALDEIAAARLTDDDRELLERRICAELGGPKGSPKLVLARFVDSMQRGSWRWTLGGYFKMWMDRDPDEAIEWLAKHVDQMKDLSFGFLEVSFHPLLVTSPETAGRLLQAIPPDRRLESLRSLQNRGMSPAEQIGWAQVVRRHLPENDRLSAITWPTMNWSDGDGSPMTMPWVSAYLERIQATPPEREACILSAARERAGVDDDEPLSQDMELSRWMKVFRKWVEGLEPDLVDKATGVALCGEFGISREALDLAIGYHAKNRNDALLLPLLERDHNHEDVPLARKLAGHLTDEILRQKYLEKFKDNNP